MDTKDIMTISMSVKRLADILASHIQKTRNDPLLISFIDEIAAMYVWADQWNLPEWERRIQHHAIMLEERDSDRDEMFQLAGEIFELGRYNMYVAIQKEETKIEYNRVGTRLKDVLSCEIPDESEFDFGAWSDKLPFG